MRISDWSSDVFSSDLLGLARDRRRRNQPPRSRYLANREDDARANLSRRGLGRFTSDVRSEVAVVITADDKIEIGAPGPPELTDRKQVLGGEGDDRGRIAGAMHSMHRGHSFAEIYRLTPTRELTEDEEKPACPPTSQEPLRTIGPD